ncbi:MAG: 23S rRNA (adenine(2503)-C(2))-methyltransferase RlmN [Victivallales bacterium]|nr:23S rRNA (adenine(2503)-C(2))-methyltransferase RlmN [Victivallales bacterium]
MTPGRELFRWLEFEGQRAFRADQIMGWIYRKWTLDPLEMQNLPECLRIRLSDSFSCGTVKMLDSQSAPDGTAKLLLGLHDGQTIESVIIPHGSRTTFCLSSQVGCPVGCRFCASGTGGLVRNLHAGEIVEQLLACCRHYGARPDNLVFMGVGEPLMNLDNLLVALEAICDKARFDFAQRRITISTSGWTAGIRRLAECRRQFNLAVSLHGSDDSVRKKLIPNCRRPLHEILDACDHYRSQTGRMVTFEYTLIDGVNSRPEQATELADIAKRSRAKVNLIPLNAVPSLPFGPPQRDVIKKFMSVLEARGVQVSIRIGKGSSVAAACGQLRSSAGTY